MHIQKAKEQNKVIFEQELDDLIDIFCPDVHNYNVLSAVFKDRIITFKAGHMGDR